MDKQKILLTQTVQKGGCAAKVPANDLRRILQNVKFPNPHKNLLIDGRLFDDAAIYKVSDQIALVQTLDFFTPIVDTPKVFGEIAAANALSDVYAMGGRPKTAMGILAYPSSNMQDNVIIDIMQGASNKIEEANANFVGGHSIDDDTLKFGLSVTGFVDPENIWSNAGANIGDNLILTKPLGTGTMTAALKRQAVSEEDITEAIESMSMINNAVDYLGPNELLSIHAATDITGFGLSGHCMQLANASQVSLKIQTASIPYFNKTISFLESGYLTKAHRTNSEYTEKSICIDNLDKLSKLLVHDPQTSGGLILSVHPSKTSILINLLKQKFTQTTVIGEVIPRSTKAVYFE